MSYTSHFSRSHHATLTDPHHFIEHTLKITPWPKITEIIEAVKSGKRKILVRSCNGAGKTTTIAALCNWKLKNFEDSIVLTTASSWVQVRRTLWGEIRKQARMASLYDGKHITSTSIKLSDKHFALGISPNIPENAQGFHSPTMLIAVDEATGVDREIINALWGNATSAHSQMIMIYNPIDTQSFPFDAEAAGDWHLITISAFDHPNVITGENLIDGAVTREWIEDRLRAWSHEVEPESAEDPSCVHVPWLDKYFRKTNIVASRICGEWPQDTGYGFITQDLLNRSLSVEAKTGIKSIGVDVARSGEDKTVIAFFDGNTQLDFESFVGRDLMRTANRIRQLYEEGWRVIGIDDTGIGGGVTDRLREQNIAVHAINFSAKPRGFLRGKDLMNTRTELYFVIEDELKRGEIKLLNDRELHQELTAARLIGVNTTYRLEPKELIRRRLGRSPDKADATVIARYAIRLNERGGIKYFF